mmetsp:Transcript_65740/g.80458  ORF Transcript_65740/g.80458 Transcript_65740/m.80458 type:complete len:108 (-) Transcript_65740:431-754(-)
MGILTVTSIILGIVYGCGFGALKFERIFGILFIFWMCICVSSILIGFIYYFGYQSEWEDYLTSIGDVMILVSINIYTISEIFTSDNEFRYNSIPPPNDEFMAVNVKV